VLMIVFITPWRLLATCNYIIHDSSSDSEVFLFMYSMVLFGILQP